MQVKNNRGEFVEVDKITIQTDQDTMFRITVGIDNRLNIVKVHDDDSRINVHPVVSNKLEIF